jgi:hypothetical protein
MTLPSSPNSISLKQIQTEFGGADPISISEYYRNGSYTTSNNTNVPVDSTIHPPIKFSNFYGAVAEILVVISATTTNLNISTLFGSYWTQTVPKRLVINSGVIIGATNTSNYALNIPSGFGGTVKVQNYGSIQGAGGATNGGNGGPAILAGASGVSIDNQGSIYAGGGGGGGGGTGGAGSYVAQAGGNYSGIQAVTPVYVGSGFYSNTGLTDAVKLAGCSSACKSKFGSKWYAATPCGYTQIGSDYCSPVCKYGVTCTGGGRGTQISCSLTSSESWTCVYDYDVPTAGGTGGSGGVGQGYNQSATTAPIFGATNGPLDGGTNAGRGGVGGNGSTWGTSGGNGFVGANGTAGTAAVLGPVLGAAGGPGYGGLAGYYIVNNGNITWITTGTRLGRVG